MTRESRFDFGMLAVVLVFVAIPCAIWYLVAQLPSGEPSAEGTEVQQPDDDLVRRGERERLQRQLGQLERQLERARAERAVSPAGSQWAAEMAALHLQIVETQRRLDELRDR